MNQSFKARKLAETVGFLLAVVAALVVGSLFQAALDHFVADNSPAASSASTPVILITEPDYGPQSLWINGPPMEAPQLPDLNSSQRG